MPVRARVLPRRRRARNATLLIDEGDFRNMARLIKARFWGGLGLLLTSITLPMLVNAAPPPALPTPPFPNIATLGIPGTAGGDGIPETANQIAISSFNPRLLITGADVAIGGLYQFVDVDTSQHCGGTWDLPECRVG